MATRPDQWAEIAAAQAEAAAAMRKLVALIHATRDLRLLQMIADEFDLAVIEQRYLPAIEDAVLDDKIAELTQRRVLARRRWKGAQ